MRKLSILIPMLGLVFYVCTHHASTFIELSPEVAGTVRGGIYDGAGGGGGGGDCSISYDTTSGCSYCHVFTLEGGVKRSSGCTSSGSLDDCTPSDGSCEECIAGDAQDCGGQLANYTDGTCSQGQTIIQACTRSFNITTDTEGVGTCPDCAFP